MLGSLAAAFRYFSPILAFYIARLYDPPDIILLRVVDRYIFDADGLF
jgi:hypothetical protein